MAQSREKYAKRLGVPEQQKQSDPSRQQWVSSTSNWLRRKLPKSLSFFSVTIDGEPRNVAIVSSNNNNEKKIISMPGEKLECGSYVKWMDNVWLITELNAADELYQYAVMQQCNHLLKWINDRGEIVERWVCAADGTKYMTGEYYQSMLTVGDARFQITMPRDEETAKIRRGDRFVIDDPLASDPLAYELTKPNRVSYTFTAESRGVYIHMFVESPVQQDDNLELMIANYYSKMEKARAAQAGAAAQTLTQIVVTSSDGTNDIYVGTSKTLSVLTYIGGAPAESAAYKCSLDCGEDIATFECDGGNVTIISAGDRKNAGTIVTLSIRDEINGADYTGEYKIRRWV